MTIKELSEFTGKTERTIRNWVKKASEKVSSISEKVSNAYNRKESSDFSIDEIEQILLCSSMSKDAVNILILNAKANNKMAIINVEKNLDIETGTSSMVVMMDFMAKMQQQQQQFMNTVIDRLDNKPKESKQLLLPPTPDVKPRALLRQLVSDYASSINISHREAWNELYKQFYYRCNESIKIKAKNLNIIPLDYLENENKLLTACSIMKDLIK